MPAHEGKVRVVDERIYGLVASGYICLQSAVAPCTVGMPAACQVHERYSYLAWRKAVEVSPTVQTGDEDLDAIFEHRAFTASLQIPVEKLQSQALQVDEGVITQCVGPKTVTSA